MDSPRSAISFVMLFLLLPLGTLVAGDCNQNGVDDLRDLSEGTSSDCNGNIVPDECDALRPSRRDVTRSYPVVADPRWVRTGDFNGDADPDLVVLSDNDDNDPTDNLVSVLLSRGDGTFGEHVDTPVDTPDATANNTTTMIAGDFNTDSKLDIAVLGSLSNGHVLQVLRNTGDGSFVPGPIQDGPGSIRPNSFITEDFNSDGALDLAFGTRERVGDLRPTSVVLLLNNGTGLFPEARKISVPDVPWSLASADLNGDANTDIIAFTAQNGDILALFNDGRGTFTEPEVLIGGAPCQVPDLCVVRVDDFDGDGSPDIVAATQHNTVELFLNLGQGQFSAGGRLVVPAFEAAFVEVGDLNRDGIPDLAIVETSIGPFNQTVAVYLNTGAATFERIEAVIEGNSVVLSDVDGDGTLDIVSRRRRAGVVSVRLNLADGTFPIADDGVTLDKNQNGVLDECERAEFRRGDANADSVRDVSDVLLALEFLFLSGSRPACLKALDTEDSGEVNIADPIYLLNFLFLNGAAPPEPFAACAADPTEDALPCDAFAGCSP